MTTLVARVEFEDKDHNQAVVRVQTSRCFYSVAIQGDSVTIIGPGVEKEFFFDNDWPDVFDDLSVKGKALVAVTLLEEEE
jgi:hypothetical protein